MFTSEGAFVLNQQGTKRSPFGSLKNQRMESFHEKLSMKSFEETEDPYPEIVEAVPQPDRNLARCVALVELEVDIDCDLLQVIFIRISIVLSGSKLEVSSREDIGHRLGREKDGKDFLALEKARASGRLPSVVLYSCTKLEATL